MSIQALILDFDGLIVDTETSDYEAWCLIYKHFGCQLERELWLQSVGKAGAFDPHKHLELLICRALERENIAAWHSKIHLELMAAQQLLPGVSFVINHGYTSGFRIGVASNSLLSRVKHGLEYFKLDQFVSTIRTRDRVKNPKPHPEPYLLALEDLGADPINSIAFEDSESGIKSAKDAGLYVVAVPSPFTRHHDFSGADEVLNSLDEFVFDKGQLLQDEAHTDSFQSSKH